ncbi:MAG: uncharacterized protein K0S04_659 [Herbinix sp.]|jgi:uncharacterized protein with FMN-binding domain|nr:uncharacterized protein [Herbinix sp.]
MSKLKRFFIVISFILFVIVAAGIFGFFQINKSIKSYESFSFGGLDLSQVEDGTYTGSEDGGMVNAAVEVTVENHTITKINILSHECGTGKPAEVIVNDIVANNSLEVDTIGGATYSSNVLRVAVYHALTNN